MDFTIKQGDTRTVMKCTLYNPSGSVVDLSGATTQLILSDGVNKVLITGTIQDALNGIVWIGFGESTLDVFDGWVKGEILVTFPDDFTETYPNNGYLKVNIVKRI